jgi:hypothetical protein
MGFYIPRKIINKEMFTSQEKFDRGSTIEAKILSKRFICILLHYVHDSLNRREKNKFFTVFRNIYIFFANLQQYFKISKRLYIYIFHYFSQKR